MNKSANVRACAWALTYRVFTGNSQGHKARIRTMSTPFFAPMQLPVSLN